MAALLPTIITVIGIEGDGTTTAVAWMIATTSKSFLLAGDFVSAAMAVGALSLNVTPQLV
jgi:ABC-type uncharacterized transport system YnjBCD ATPase subunit